MIPQRLSELSDFLDENFPPDHPYFSARILAFPADAHSARRRLAACGVSRLWAAAAAAEFLALP